MISEHDPVVGVSIVCTVMDNFMIVGCPNYLQSIKALVIYITGHRNVDHSMVAMFSIPMCWS